MRKRGNKMKIAYICSPYRVAGKQEKETIKIIHKRNVEYAQSLTRKAIQFGYAPITPHLYITQAVDDDIEQERQQGLNAGLAILKGCDLLLVGDRYGISSGMRGEIEKAEEMGLQIITERELDTAIMLIKEREGSSNG